MKLLDKFNSWLSKKRTERKRKSLSPEQVHPRVQRLSRRCVSCGEKILSTAGKRSYQCNMRPSVSSVTFSGGKITCGDCVHEASKYCVHGMELSKGCIYCDLKYDERRLYPKEEDW